MTKKDNHSIETEAPTPGISSKFMSIVFELVPKFGINPDQQLFEIDRESLEDPTKRFPLPLINRLWNRMVANVQDPDFGLHIGELFELPMDLLNFIVFNSPSVKIALENLSRYHTLFQDACRPVLSTSGDSPKLIIEIANAITEHGAMAEAYLAYFYKLSTRLLGKKIILDRVNFVRPIPENTSEHKRIFDTHLFFDQKENSFCFDKAYLDMPVSAANPELLKSLEIHAKNLLKGLSRENTFSSQVEKAVSIALATGKTDIDSIAGNLGLTTRSLQNKLKSEDTRYQKLLENVKKNQAKYFLSQTDMSILDITFLLGYSEQSSFNRAFKNWTKLSPGEYRVKQGLGEKNRHEMHPST